MSRDPRSDRTVRSLRSALVELVAEKEFEAITVTDVVERAGLHRATFYRHYTDKADLLRLWGLEILDLLEQQADSAAALSAPSAQAPPIVSLIFEHVDSQRPFYRLMVGRSALPSISRDLERRMAQFLLKHHLLIFGPEPSGPPRALLCWAYAGYFVAAVRWWLSHAPETTGTQMADWIWQASSPTPSTCDPPPPQHKTAPDGPQMPLPPSPQRKADP
jgi:AcrR family transcriptional regulator